MVEKKANSAEENKYIHEGNRFKAKAEKDLKRIFKGAQ